MLELKSYGTIPIEELKDMVTTGMQQKNVGKVKE